MRNKRPKTYAAPAFLIPLVPENALLCISTAPALNPPTLAVALSLAKRHRNLPAVGALCEIR